MNHKFIVYDRKSNLLIAVYDVRIRNEMRHTGEYYINNISHPLCEDIEVVEFLVYEKEKKQWVYKDSSCFEEFIET